MIRRTYKYRLNPTREQAELFGQTLEFCREFYNAALQERREAWRVGGVTVSFAAQSAQLPEIKEARAELCGVNAQVLQDVLHRVDKTFKAFFARAGRGVGAGYPRFKPASRYDSFTYPQQGFSIRDKRLCLSKIGKVRIKLHRPVEGKIKTLTLKREAGRWYACFSVEFEPKPAPANRAAVGIDVGLTAFATLSDGSEVENPRYHGRAQRRLRRAQRRAARRKKGSRRRRKAVLLLQRAHAHVRNQRADFHHKLSRQLVKTYGLIAVEDLNFKGLSAGMLAKQVKDAAWSSFIEKLAYKAEEAGRRLVRVDPRGTSQRCVCGSAVPKKLNQRRHACPACGLNTGRDHASAMEILRLGLSLQALT